MHVYCKCVCLPVRLHIYMFGLFGRLYEDVFICLFEDVFIDLFEDCVYLCVRPIEFRFDPIWIPSLKSLSVSALSLLDLVPEVQNPFML